MALDIKHFYMEKGHGIPIILLHGNGENCDYFQGQIAAFSKDYHVYAMDTRGHGKTPRGDMPFTIRQFADDLLAFMDEHQIEKAHLLGFSDGGNIAMVFAIQYPNRVNRLILNGANLNADGVKRTIQIPIEIGYKIARKFSDKSDARRTCGNTSKNTGHCRKEGHDQGRTHKTNCGKYSKCYPPVHQGRSFYCK